MSVSVSCHAASCAPPMTRCSACQGTDSCVFPHLGSSWGESSSGRITNWLVLKNLTPQVRLERARRWQVARSELCTNCSHILHSFHPQIDGSTLRTLCMQHGPLITFHLNLPHGNALVRYSSKEEVVKAQKSLHM